MKSFSRDVYSALIFASVVALLVLAATSAGWAQKDMGNIVGLVKDRTGAVVTDAKVAVRDVDRGTIFPTTTNSSGEYVAGPLRIGQYTVTVEKSGFKRAVAGPITLNVQDRLAVDRADFFNIWNHMNGLWGPVGAAGQVEPVAIELGTPQFGSLQAARDPRFVQFAMKFYF